ncbi:MAG: type II toxin-antitoxin system HicA family toxin [Chloroflexi bacterium]|nr:type II toxin-antitoxin system HicA family toxin [Chloroflexota bacterium]
MPALRSREVVRGLRRMGFERVRQKGSHAIFHHRDCRRAPIPIHPANTISPYFLSDILKQLRIEEDEFLRAVGRT